MNLKQKFAVSSLSFILGLLILLVSLVKTSAVKALSEAEVETSSKQFYLGQELKPDHVLYPVRVAREKVSLLMLDPDDRVEKKIEYAQQRLDFSRELLEKGEYQLALATLFKSQQYLFEAAQYIESTNSSQTSYSNLLHTLENHIENIESMSSSYPQNFANQLQQLKANQEAVVYKLKNLVN